MDRTSTRILIGLLFISIQAFKYFIYGKQLEKMKTLKIVNRFIQDKISIGKIGSRIPISIHEASCLPLWPEK